MGAPRFPFSTETLPLAEQCRRALLGKSKDLARRRDTRLAEADIGPLVPAFWGKDEQGRPRTGHQHAFFLPTDDDGDGRLDHLTVFAPMGFGDLELQALDRLRRVSWGDADPLRLLLVGLGQPRDLRVPLLAAAAVWVSATPFVVTRYPKRRGRKRDRPEDYATPSAFAELVLRQELARRPGLPAVVALEAQEHLGPHRRRPLQFHRFRNKRSDDGGRRIAASFRVTFATPLTGPLCLGHSCHFGLGLFVPE